MNVSNVAMSNANVKPAMMIMKTLFNVTGNLTMTNSNLVDYDSTPKNLFLEGFGNQAAFVLFLLFSVFFCIIWCCTDTGVTIDKLCNKDNKDETSKIIRSGCVSTSCGSFVLMIGCILLTISAANLGLIQRLDYHGAMPVIKVDVSTKLLSVQCDDVSQSCNVGNVRARRQCCVLPVALPEMSVNFGGESMCPSVPEKDCHSQVDYSPCNIQVICEGQKCDYETALAKSAQCINHKIGFRKLPWMDGAQQSVILYGNCQTCEARLELPRSKERTNHLKVAGIATSSIGLFVFLIGIITLSVLFCCVC